MASFLSKFSAIPSGGQIGPQLPIGGVGFNNSLANFNTMMKNPSLQNALMMGGAGLQQGGLPGMFSMGGMPGMGGGLGMGGMPFPSYLPFLNQEKKDDEKKNKGGLMNLLSMTKVR